jgi:hypothetical protein
VVGVVELEVIVVVIVVAEAILCSIHRRSVISYEGMQQVKPRWYAEIVRDAFEDQVDKVSIVIATSRAESWRLALISESSRLSPTCQGACTPHVETIWKERRKDL